jgi:hypothetical protein
MNINNLTPQQLRNAADLKERLDALQERLNGLLGGEEGPSAVGRKVWRPQRLRARKAG